MLRQILILLSAVTLALAAGNGWSKKNVAQKQQSQFSSVASYHSSKPAAAAPKPAIAPIQSVVPVLAVAPVQAPQPYSFEYEADGSSRKESADASGKVTGSYKVINEDGTIRVVNYVADELGFRADIDTNEAGTKSSNPSNVALKSAFVEPPAPVAAAAPKKYAAKGFAETKVSQAQFEQKPVQYNTDNGASGAYSYNYEAQLEDGGSSARSESADASGAVTGHYSLSVADGRMRKVDYSSGNSGFQAKVETNEFGTKSDSPAHVQFYSSAPQQQAAPAPTSYAQQSSFAQQKQIDTYSSATPIRQEPVQAPAHSFSQQPIQQENIKPLPYSFNYDAQLEDGSSSRSESSDGSGKVIGSYSLATADGRQRTIDYEADHMGFRAKVNTNEFGTKSDSPADAQFYSSASVEAPAAPAFKSAAQHKTAGSSTKSSFHSQAATSSNQYQTSFQSQQSVDQYSAGAESYAPYAFNYLAELDDGTSSRSESADGSGKVVGSYGLTINDGRTRTVDYVADQGGFRASVNTNEFGTKNDSPADVQFYSSAVQEEAAPAPQTYAASGSAGFTSKTSSATAFGSQATHHSAGVAKPIFQSSGMKQAPISQQQVAAEPFYQPSPYSFNYEAEAAGGSSARNEASDASGTVTGSYTVRNEDGSVRVVEYVADKNGFRANVKTNEPGTKSDDPADVMFKSDAPVVAPSAPVKKQTHQAAVAPSVPVRQQAPLAQKPSFPARAHTQKTSMLTQQNIEPWRR